MHKLGKQKLDTKPGGSGRAGAAFPVGESNSHWCGLWTLCRPFTCTVKERHQISKADHNLTATPTWEQCDGQPSVVWSRLKQHESVRLYSESHDRMSRLSRLFSRLETSPSSGSQWKLSPLGEAESLDSQVVAAADHTRPAGEMRRKDKRLLQVAGLLIAALLFFPNVGLWSLYRDRVFDNSPGTVDGPGGILQIQVRVWSRLSN